MQKALFIFCCLFVDLNVLNWLFESHFLKISDNLEEIHEKARKRHGAYLGARFANGSLGLIVDPSADRLLGPYYIHPNNQSVCNVEIEGKGGRQVLNKVRKGIVAYQSKRNETKEGGPPARPRLLCMVYTYEPAHENV